MSADKHNKGTRRRAKVLGLIAGKTKHPSAYACHEGVIVCHKRALLHDVDKPRTAAGWPQYTDFTRDLKKLEKSGLVKRVRVRTGGMFQHICRTFLVATDKPETPKPRRKLRDSRGQRR